MYLGLNDSGLPYDPSNVLAPEDDPINLGMIEDDEDEEVVEDIIAELGGNDPAAAADEEEKESVAELS